MEGRLKDLFPSTDLGIIRKTSASSTDNAVEVIALKDVKEPLKLHPLCTSRYPSSDYCCEGDLVEHKGVLYTITIDDDEPSIDQVNLEITTSELRLVSRSPEVAEAMSFVNLALGLGSGSRDSKSWPPPPLAPFTSKYIWEIKSILRIRMFEEVQANRLRQLLEDEVGVTDEDEDDIDNNFGGSTPRLHVRVLSPELVRWLALLAKWKINTLAELLDLEESTFVTMIAHDDFLSETILSCKIIGLRRDMPKIE